MDQSLEPPKLVRQNAYVKTQKRKLDPAKLDQSKRRYVDKSNDRPRYVDKCNPENNDHPYAYLF